MIKNGDLKIYIDPAGVSHNALVTATNPMHEDVLDLVYFHPTEGIKQVWGIHHFSHESKKESKRVAVSDLAAAQQGVTELIGNPDLPDYQLNAWKEPGEEHNELPADHPNNAHPFAAMKAEPVKPVAQGPDITVEQLPVEKKRPTIAELEAILNDPTPQKVVVNPDGSISAKLNQNSVTSLVEAGFEMNKTTSETLGSGLGEFHASIPSDPDVTTQLQNAGPAPEEPTAEPPAE